MDEKDPMMTGQEGHGITIQVKPAYRIAATHALINRDDLTAALLQMNPFRIQTAQENYSQFQLYLLFPHLHRRQMAATSNLVNNIRANFDMA